MSLTRRIATLRAGSLRVLASFFFLFYTLSGESCFCFPLSALQNLSIVSNSSQASDTDNAVKQMNKLRYEKGKQQAKKKC